MAPDTLAREQELLADFGWLLDSTAAEMDAYMQALSAEERTVLDQWIDQQTPWRSTPATMAHFLTDGEMKLWRYVRLLGRKFRQAVTGESPRQIWNLPARYGKSTIASQWGPAWGLDRDPRLKLILTSYGDELAMENAIAVRDILRQHPHLLRAQMRRDRQRNDRFVTTQGGGVLGRGIGSGITGFGAHGAVIDDPFKNWQDAHSQATRDKIDNNYRSVIRLRLETENAFVIVVHTRWHEDDLTNRLLGQMEDGTGEAWDLVRLPAIAEEYDPNSFDRYLRMPDPLGREPGEVLEPERFTLTAVKARHLALGCTPAETPVLMADWTVKPVGKVEAGDEVVGWVNERGHKMRYVPTTVVATTCAPGEVLDYRMGSGRVVRATRDHRWFTRSGRPYRPANVGTPLRFICPVDEQPQTEHERDLWSYLAGIVDGEGHVSPTRRLNIVQSFGRNTPVVERILATLDELDISYNATYQARRHEHWSDRLSIDVTEVARVYRMLLRHTPLAKRQQVVDALYGGAGRMERGQDRVVAIERPVTEDVYALQTGTGNYVAWGYASSNSYLTAGMEQQRPAPAEGGILKRNWWKLEDSMPVKADQWMSSWDMKLKDKETSDYTVGQVWARTGKDCWLVDQFRGSWSQAVTVNALALLTIRYPQCRRHVVENAGYGPEVIEALRVPAPGYVVSEDIAGQLGMTRDEREAVALVRQRGVPGIVANNVKGSKSIRARAVAPYIEAGDVHLPARAQWLPAFLDEVSAFDNGLNDDQVDAMSQAVAKLHNLGLHRTRTFGAELRSTRAHSVG